MGAGTFLAPAWSQESSVWEQTGGPYGGDIIAIAENPLTGELWASASADQFYVSDDGGRSWSARGGVASSGIAFRSDGYIFTRYRRSSDNGLSWKDMTIPDSVSVTTIVIDEATGNLIAGTNHGLYYSHTSGSTWQVGLALNSWIRDNDVIVIGGGYVFTITDDNNRRLLRSDDGGVHWVETPQVPGRTPMGFTVGPDNRVYMTTYPAQRLYSSSDLGETWELVVDLSQIGCLGGKLLGFDTTGQLFIKSNSLYRLSSDFTSCDMIFDGSRRVYPESTVESSAGIGDAFVDSQDQVFVASGAGGFFRSQDGGNSWTLSAYGIKGTRVQHIAIDDRTGVILAGTRENGVFRSEDHGQSWDYVGFVERSINKVAAGAKPGEWWVATYHDGVHRSDDDGNTWTFLANPLHKSIIKDFYYDQPSKTFFVRYRWGDKVYYSQDEGETWNGLEIPHEINENETVLAITVADDGYLYVCVQEGIQPQEPVLKFYRTQDLGKNWEEIPHPLPYRVPAESFVELFVDSTDRLWAANETRSLDGKLYYTNDGGQNWTLSLERPYFDFAAFLETPDGSIWIADHEGTLRSSDRGQAWQRNTDGLRHLDVHSLTLDSQTARIFAGTHGGSVYQTAVDLSVISIEDEKPDLAVFELRAAYPNPFNLVATIGYALPRPSEVKIEVFDLLGRRVRVLENGFKPIGEYEVTLDATGLPSGVYFYTLSAGDFTQTRKIVVVR